MRLNLSFKSLFWTCLLLHLVCAFFSSGFHHFDEHFQIIEFLSFKMGQTEASQLPWEYHEKVRPWFQVGLYTFFYQIFNFLGVQSPFLHTTLLRIITSIFGFFCLWQFNDVIRKWTKNKNLHLTYCTLFHLLWFVPYIQTRLNSESMASSFFILGLVYFFKERRLIKDDFMAGFFLGLSFLCRSQMGLIVAGIWLWALFFQRIDERVPHRKLFLSSMAIIFTFGIGLLADYWGYGSWDLSQYHYIKLNFFEGKLAAGTHRPLWYYLSSSLSKGVPPVSLFLVMATIIGWIRFPKHPLTWATLPLFIIHSLISHKELRYLFPIMLLCPIYLFLLYEQSHKIQALIKKKWFTLVAKVTIFTNIVVLLFSITRPANPAVNFYHFIYNRPDIKVLKYLDEDPYTMLGLPINFYKRKNFQTQKVASLDSLPPGIHHLFFKRGQDVIKMDQRKNCQRLNMTYPKWSLKFNISNWVSRSRVWSLYSCKVY